MQMQFIQQLCETSQTGRMGLGVGGGGCWEDGAYGLSHFVCFNIEKLNVP